MTEQRRPLRDKKAWAGGSQKRRGNWTERNGNGIWDSQYVCMDRIYKDVTCVKWGSGLLKDNPQSRWRLLRVDCDGMSKRGVGRATVLWMLSFHIISIIIRIIKKSFGCPELKSSSRAKWVRLKACHTKFSLPICFLYILAIILSLIRPHIPSISHKPAS